MPSVAHWRRGPIAPIVVLITEGTASSNGLALAGAVGEAVGAGGSLPVTAGLADTGSPSTNGTNLQTAITAATWGAQLVLQAGAIYEGNFTLPNKGTPPTGTDADYITITTSQPSQTPAALSNYPAQQTRITTAMATGMPVVRSATANSVFEFQTGSKYWKLERLNITNRDTGVQLIAMISQATMGALADYPDRVIIQYNWIHPIEEVGTALSLANRDRTAENSIYLRATHVTIRRNAMQGFVGHRKYGGGTITSSNLLITDYGDTYLVEQNLLEAWTYAFFAGGSAIPNWLVTQGGTVSSCTSTSCTFSTTTGLAPGDPIGVKISTAGPTECAGTAVGLCWGSAFVATIVGSTVTFVAPLCHSPDGNVCTEVPVLPSNGDAVRWDGLNIANVTVRQNIFAHYPEWKTYTDGESCGGKGYLEVKSCTNCVFDANIFTGCSGPTVTVRNQNMDLPWANLDGLTFTNNYFKHSNRPFTAAFQDNIPTRKSRDITWRNNLYVGVDASLNSFLHGGEESQAFFGAVNLTIAHNTVLWANPSWNGTTQLNAAYGFTNGSVSRTMENFVMQDNILMAGNQTCWQDDAKTIPTAFTNCWPAATVNHNVILNTDGYDVTYPPIWFPFPGQTFLTSVSSVGFTSAPAALDATGNYRLTSGSAYHNTASDGTDYGCHIDALNAALGFTAA